MRVSMRNLVSQTQARMPSFREYVATGRGAEFQGFALRKSESGDSVVRDSDDIKHL